MLPFQLSLSDRNKIIALELEIEEVEEEKEIEKKSKWYHIFRRKK